MKKKSVQHMLLFTMVIGFIVEIILDAKGIKQTELDGASYQMTNIMLICTYAICKHLDKDTL